MNILVILLNQRSMRWTFFKNEHSCCGTAKYEIKSRGSNISDRLRSINKKCGQLPDAIAIRVAFGGSVFKNPVIANAENIKKLEKLIPEAPFHLPMTIELIKKCTEAFCGVPVILIFETSFFANLSARETLYGIDVQTANKLNLKRYGYNGIYHQAACRMVRRVKKQRTPKRVISICLEAQPEIAAVMGNHPVAVSSGATPLEGIPGQTTCGQLDASVVLTLAEKKRWGPEQINNVLTQQSGILGLTGQKLDLEDIFKSDLKENDLIRKLITYQILIACGAAIAAMGGVDEIIFSGKFGKLGKILGPYLADKIDNLAGDKKINWEILTASRENIIRELASIMLLKEDDNGFRKAV